LLAIRALNEALHPTLRRSQESALQESHEGGRFHTARVKSGIAQQEHMTSALPLQTGYARAGYATSLSAISPL
jgi:hypothetical protein